ncbi:MAG: hypothetical protein ACK4RK_19190 [Gemmataceae bacterium]
MPNDRFTCPECGTTMKTAKPMPSGTKIKCPKCTAVFAATAQTAAKVTKPAAARRSAPPPKSSKGVLIGTLLFLTLLVAGGMAAWALLPPELLGLKKTTEVAKATNPTTQPTNIQPATTEPKGQQPPDTQPTPVTGKIDLTYVTPNFTAAVIINPQQIMQAKALAPFLTNEILDFAEQLLGTNPRDFEQFILLVEPQLLDQKMPVAPAFITKFNKPIDGEAFLQQGIPGIEKEMMDGKVVYSAVLDNPLGPQAGGIDKVPVYSHVADDRTLIAAPQPTLKKMLSGAAGNSLLRDKLARFDTSHDLTVVVTLDKIGPVLSVMLMQADQEGTIPPPFADVVKLPEILDSATLIVNISRDPLLRLTLDSKTPEGAATVENLVQMLHGMGKTMYPELREEGESDLPPEMAKELLPALDQMWNGLSVQRDGASVSVSVPRPEKLGALLLLIPRAVQGGSPINNDPPPPPPDAPGHASPDAAMDAYLLTPNVSPPNN